MTEIFLQREMEGLFVGEIFRGKLRRPVYGQKIYPLYTLYLPKIFNSVRMTFRFPEFRFSIATLVLLVLYLEFQINVQETLAGRI